MIKFKSSVFMSLVLLQPMLGMENQNRLLAIEVNLDEIIEAKDMDEDRESIREKINNFCNLPTVPENKNIREECLEQLVHVTLFRGIVAGSVEGMNQAKKNSLKEKGERLFAKAKVESFQTKKWAFAALCGFSFSVISLKFNWFNEKISLASGLLGSTCALNAARSYYKCNKKMERVQELADQLRK